MGGYRKLDKCRLGGSSHLVTVLSLGLFLFVINALLFWAAASVLEGFAVTGFGAALIGSLIYSLCGMVIDVLIERLFPTPE